MIRKSMAASPFLNRASKQRRTARPGGNDQTLRRDGLADRLGHALRHPDHPMMSNKPVSSVATPPSDNGLPYDVVALVLQGGGALGAYQAGVVEGLHEAGIHPNWVAGISIGALNCAI